MTAEEISVVNELDLTSSLSDDAKECVQRLQHVITKEMPTVLPPVNSEARYPIQMKQYALENAKKLLRTLELIDPKLMIAIPGSVGHMRFEINLISLNDIVDALRIVQQYIWSLEEYTEVVAISLSVPNPKRLRVDEEPSDFLTPSLREVNGQFEICIAPNLIELRRVSTKDIDRRAKEISSYVQEKLYPGTVREKILKPLYRCQSCNTTYEQKGQAIVCPHCGDVAYNVLQYISKEQQ